MLVELKVGVAINPGNKYSLEITNLSTYNNRQQELMTRKAFNHIQKNYRAKELWSYFTDFLQHFMGKLPV